jgi:hypothetical protein
MTRRHDPTALAVGLLVAYLAQAAIGLDVPWLLRLQADDTYKIATGCMLVAYLGLQWSAGPHHRERHKLLGALAPLALYVHASRFAYGYLVWLAAVYLSVGAIGLLHQPITVRRARRWFVAWFITHVALAVLLVILVGYHVLIALAYE